LTRKDRVDPECVIHAGEVFLAAGRAALKD